MISDSTSILLYGSDPTLLNTRRWILEARGFRVVSASRLYELCDIPPEPSVQIFILCHSVSADEGRDALELADSRWPGICNLVLSGNLLKPRVGSGATLELALSGPLRLIAAVEALAGDPAQVEVAAQR